MASSFHWMLLLAFSAVSIKGVHGILCYSCQYADNPTLVGWECVSSPADYTLGPTTTECSTACSSEVQKYGGTDKIYFVLRGCKTKEDGCTVGGIDVCVETCSDADLCNNENYDPGTPAPTSPPPSTIPPTTTTEIPGTISCYSCVYSYTGQPDEDDTCVTDAPNAPPPNEVRCPPSRYCTIFRQWDNAQQVVRSFRRGCDEYTGQVNNCVEDLYFTTCNTYCNTNYCNSGDGTLPLRGKKLRKVKATETKKKEAAIKI